jgi:hypothetical protein
MRVDEVVLWMQAKAAHVFLLVTPSKFLTAARVIEIAPGIDAS